MLVVAAHVVGHGDVADRTSPVVGSHQPGDLVERLTPPRTDVEDPAALRMIDEPQCHGDDVGHEDEVASLLAVPETATPGE